jgi:hypothetical protein
VEQRLPDSDVLHPRRCGVSELEIEGADALGIE